MIFGAFFISFGMMIIIVNAECPNGCAGHGRCGVFDSCVCYRRWVGNDCSQRLCLFDISHVDTPKGDLDFSTGTLSSKVVAFDSQIYPYGTAELFPVMSDSRGSSAYPSSLLANILVTVFPPQCCRTPLTTTKSVLTKVSVIAHLAHVNAFLAMKETHVNGPLAQSMMAECVAVMGLA